MAFTNRAHFGAVKVSQLFAIKRFTGMSRGLDDFVVADCEKYAVPNAEIQVNRLHLSSFNRSLALNVCPVVEICFCV